MPYLGKSPQNGVRNRFQYQATAGQTSFTGSDANSLVLTYTDSLYLDVYQNGVLLVPGTDYAATTGTSVVLVTGASTGDVVEMIVYDTFGVADTVSAKDGGAFAGAVSMASTLAVTGAITSSAGATITTADNNPQLTLKSTDADANVGPLLVMMRDSSSPADNDILARIDFKGDNDAGEETFFGSINAIATDITDGTEDAQIKHRLMVGGTVSNVLELNSSEIIFNEDSKDIDFRVESDLQANAFFLEGSTGNVCIGSNAPTADGSLAGVSVPSGTKYFQIHETDGSAVKISDPDKGSNRGAQFALFNTTAILNNCESGNLLIGQGNAEVARFHQGGVCSFGTTTANYTTTQGFVVVPASNGYIANGHASGTANGTSYQLFSLAGTAIGSVSQASSSSVAYNTTSDYRRKTAVTYDWDATTRLKQLKPCRFKWISEGDSAPFVDGFLAHEVSDTVPEAITGEKDAMKDEEYVVTEAKGDIYTPATDDADEVIHSSNVERPMSLADGQAWRETAPQVMGTRNVPDYQQIDQSKIVPLLVKTIQELEARITALEA